MRKVFVPGKGGEAYPIKKGFNRVSPRDISLTFGSNGNRFKIDPANLHLTSNEGCSRGHSCNTLPQKEKTLLSP
jgi:hypothetical protein